MENKTHKKLVEGKVVSTKMKDTVTVSVMHLHVHPLYRKAVKRFKKFAVHNPGLELAVGDFVIISEIKPMSKKKHFIVVSKKVKG